MFKDCLIKMEDCPHDIVDGGVCRQCGYVFSGSTRERNAGIKKTPVLGIIEDIKSLNYTSEITDGAIEFLKKLEKIFSIRKDSLSRRGGRRRQLILYCIYASYILQGKIIDPLEIAIKLKLEQCDIAQALREYHTVEMKEIVNLNLTTIDLIPYYCRLLNFSSECTKDIGNLAQSILKKKPNLEKLHSPRKIAAGIIDYYLDTRCFHIDKDVRGKSIITETFKFSGATISAMNRAIAEIDAQ